MTRRCELATGSGATHRPRSHDPLRSHQCPPDPEGPAPARDPAPGARPHPGRAGHRQWDQPVSRVNAFGRRHTHVTPAPQPDCRRTPPCCSSSSESWWAVRPLSISISNRLRKRSALRWHSPQQRLVELHRSTTWSDTTPGAPLERSHIRPENARTHAPQSASVHLSPPE